jgi:hypothetical protein
VIVLCELLEVDLEDGRLARIRETTLEMVADSEASETAGLSWSLTVSVLERGRSCGHRTHRETSYYRLRRMVESMNEAPIRLVRLSPDSDDVYTDHFIARRSPLYTPTRPPALS